MTPATCVIYNPAAGRGRAERLLKEFAANPRVHGDLRQTTAPGHAEELAHAAALEGFARVIAAGGDGTVHEVANGLIRSGRRGVVFSTWPVGSANDYAYTLGLTAWWAKRAENPPTETLDVDVARVTAGGRERYAVNAAGVGFNGMVTVESRKIRFLRGMPLYTLAFLKAMVRHFATPLTYVRFDDVEWSGPTLALTMCLAQREGGFPLMPAADLTDGKLDFMLATLLRRWHLLRYLPAMARGTIPTNHPLIWLGRSGRVTVDCAEPLCAHADGELVCVPADGVKELTVEVLPRRLRVEVYPPGLYGGRRG